MFPLYKHENNKLYYYKCISENRDAPKNHHRLACNYDHRLLLPYYNGELLLHGTSTLGPHTSKTYQYVYKNPLALGEQVNFVVKAESQGITCEKIVSLPSYPPQVMPSFVSFASFSTSVMGFMASATYYESSFGSVDEGLNVGLVITIVLIILLIFLELSEPLPSSYLVLGRLRIRFTTMSAILFIIFMGIVYTKIVMILAV